MIMNITNIEITSPPYICGSVSRSRSRWPPTTIFTPEGSSKRLLSSARVASVTSLRLSPCCGSANTDTVRTPLRRTIMPRFQSGEMADTWRSGTLTPGYKPLTVELARSSGVWRPA